MTARRVVVTGATGFVGRAVARRLALEGMHVVGCARSRADGPWQEFATLDVADPMAAWPIAEGDVVVHCAGIAHDTSGRGIDDALYDRVNTAGAQRAASKARAARAGTLVLISTVKVMAESTSADGIDESAVCAPETAYGRSKLKGEWRATEELEGSGTRLAVLRLAPVYGPGTRGNLDRLMRVAERRWLPLLPANRGRRTMVHVDDVADAVASVIEESLPGTFVVAEDRTYTPREIQAQASGRRVDSRYTVPVWALRGLGRLGTGLESLVRRPVPFTSREARRLLDDAIYNGGALHTALRWKPTRTLLEGE